MGRKPRRSRLPEAKQTPVTLLDARPAAVGAEMDSQASLSSQAALARLDRREALELRRAESGLQGPDARDLDSDKVFPVISKRAGRARAGLDKRGNAGDALSAGQAGGDQLPGPGAKASTDLFSGPHTEWIPHVSREEADPAGSHPASDREGREEQQETAAHTLLISWRYEGSPPLVAKDDVSAVLRRRRGFTFRILDFRSFPHKCYVDMRCAPLTPALLREIASDLTARYSGGRAHGGDAAGSGHAENVQFFAKEDLASAEDVCTVFVARLLGADEADLLALVRERTGKEPAAVRIAKGKDGKSRNFGYVVMHSREEAKECAAALMGQPLGLSSDIRTDLFVKDGDAKPSTAQRVHRFLD